MTNSAAGFWSSYLTVRFKIQLLRQLPRIQYFDSLCTRIYIDYEDKSCSEYLFGIWKKIWHEQNIVIVEGFRSRLGVGNDLFDNAKSLKRILVPERNAFDVYEDIFNSVVKNSLKSDIILLAVGPTATVLAFDLAKVGYWALDVGHIDIEYEWFKMGATEKIVVDNKYVNEANYRGRDRFFDEKYEKSVVEKIISKAEKIS